MAYNAYPSVAQTSLAATGSTIAEEYIPLWIYSSGTASATVVTPTSATVVKGTATTTTGLPTSAYLHTLSTKWSSGQKFAFEASIYSSSASYTATAQLYDITAGSTVTTISTTATTATLLRSATVSLVPGHAYAIGIWTSASGGTVYLTKAHLVALEM